MNKKYKVSALIVAAGKGTRIGTDVPKQYMLIGDETILEKTIKTFNNNTLIDNICVVISKEHEDLFKPVLSKFQNLTYCFGGELRKDSVRNGLEMIKNTSPDLVLIQDAARPFTSTNIINEVIDSLDKNEAVIPAIKVKDTIKSCDGGIVKETLPREKLYSVQTPQGFKFKTIYDLHEKYKDHGDFTDDAALVEKAGIKVKIVDGEDMNYKITTEDDLIRARMVTKRSTRVGNGFDVHQFEEGDGVILCGIKIPHNKKLKGHSDADCAWHALTDALLGAAGLGDIGQHFPDSDAKWKGASSDIFLKHSADEIKRLGGTICNVDITIMCEEPKITPSKAVMKEKTAKVLGIGLDRVNIKATTTEKLGFLGRKEGLAAMATATIEI